MALPQQLPGISVVPQAPQIDPRLLAPDAAGALLSAQAGLHLGTELANLQNLQSKLALEKAEIAAKKAQNEYNRQAAEQAVATLPQMVEQQVQQAKANIESDKARALVGQTAQVVQPFAQALALQNVQLGQAKTASEQSTLNAFTAGGGSAASGNAAAKQALAAESIAGRTPEQQALLSATATAAGTEKGRIEGVIAGAQSANQALSTPPAPFYLSRPGAFPDAPKDFFTDPPAPLIEYKTSQVEDPTTKSVKLVSLAYNKLNGARIPAKDQEGGITLRLGDEPDKNRVIALAQTLQMAQDAKTALEGYVSGKKGGPSQALGAVWAGTPVEGPMSLGKRALGNWLQSSETAIVNAKLASLSNTITKEISGSGVTGSEMSRLTPMLVTTGDLVDPEAAKVKLDGTIKYLNDLLDPYEKRGSVTRARIGPIAGRNTSTSTTTSPLAGQSGRSGEVRTTPQGTYVFVVLPDGRSGWKRQ